LEASGEDCPRGAPRFALANSAEILERLELGPADPSGQQLREVWEGGSIDRLAQVDDTSTAALRVDDLAILYRGASGLRPLYFCCRDGGGVAFASCLCDLACAVGAFPPLARRGLHEYLRFGDISAPNTILEGVSAVAPGQAVLWSGGGVTGERLIPHPVFDAGATNIDIADAAVGVESRLSGSVRQHLAQSRRPAALLSGGIDSGLLSALGARERPDLTAVTVGFEGDDFDETPIAARIAGHLGIGHEVLRFGRAEVLGAFERLSEKSDQPSADPAAAVTLLAFEHCKARYDVVLDGTGADAAVGAMPPRHVRLAVEWASQMPQRLRRLAVQGLRRVPRLAGYAPIFDFEHPADTMIRWQGFTRREIEALCEEPVTFEETSFYRTFARFPRRAHFERYSALMESTPEDRVAQAMRISGLDLRFPFIDRSVDGYIRQLPQGLRHLPGQPKRILRAVLARHVPREVWDLPKHGFNFPLTSFLRADRCMLVQRHLMDSAVWRRTQLLSEEGVQRYGRQFIAGDDGISFRVWVLVVLGAWLEKHMPPA
jgi:asparagine synthase (glutamine-hydrolysing)